MSNYNIMKEELFVGDCGCKKRQEIKKSPCCDNPGSNEMEIKCAQIKRMIRELAQKTEAKFLIQQGKIDDLCLYLKDNLSNSIRTLLDDMEQSGELADIITETIMTEIYLLQDEVYPIGNIKRYGAVGDGTTDDTCAIKNAIADAIEHNTSLIAPFRKL